MKIYRSPRQLLAEIDRILAEKPSVHHSPLEDVIDLLCAGRHYSWMGIYLADANRGRAGDSNLAQLTSPAVHSRILVTMKLAEHEHGVLAAESDRALGSQDRVLLQTVANRLARFLVGPGKYLVRRAREQFACDENTPPTRKPQSQVSANARSMAVGEK